MPRGAMAGPPLPAAARAEGRAGGRSAPPPRRPRRVRDGGDRPGRVRVALPQQAGVLVRRTPTATSPSASTRAATGAGVVNVEDCHLASERNNAARNEVREWARDNGLPAPRVHRRARRPAPPRGARRHPHRSGPDPPRHRARRVPPPAGRPSHRHRRTFRGHRRADRRPGRGVPRGGAGRAPIPHLPSGVLSDQHGDGRDPVRNRGRLRGPRRIAARVGPLLRHRDDRALPRRAGRSPSGAWSRCPRQSPTRSGTRSATASTTPASSPPTRASASAR